MDAATKYGPLYEKLVNQLDERHTYEQKLQTTINNNYLLIIGKGNNEYFETSVNSLYNYVHELKTELEEISQEQEEIEARGTKTQIGSMNDVLTWISALLEQPTPTERSQGLKKLVSISKKRIDKAERYLERINKYLEKQEKKRIKEAKKEYKKRIKQRKYEIQNEQAAQIRNVHNIKEAQKKQPKTYGNPSWKDLDNMERPQVKTKKQKTIAEQYQQSQQLNHSSAQINARQQARHHPGFFSKKPK